MDRVGPGVPLSENLLNMFEGIKSFFEDKDEDLPSDDEEEIDESNIAQVLNKVVNKEDNDELLVKDEDDNLSEMSEKEMYHLKVLKDESDNEDSKEEGIKGEQNDDDNISFF
jgi:hypothetical protein